MLKGIHAALPRRPLGSSDGAVRGDTGHLFVGKQRMIIEVPSSRFRSASRRGAEEVKHSCPTQCSTGLQIVSGEVVVIENPHDR
jgi:hypothetical protein